MSSARPHHPHTEGQDFREAVAQWRRAVHNEVKKVSSLPTAMFDATDPMLELRLTAATEAMLAQLQMPDPQLTDAADASQVRLEAINPDEMKRVPRLIAERPPTALDLYANLDGEYLGILADSCCMQLGTARRQAAAHLCNDFAVTPDNVDARLRELHRLTLAADDCSAQCRAHDEIDSVVDQVAAVIREHLGSGKTTGAAR